MKPFRPEMSRLLPPFVARLEAASHPRRAKEFETAITEMEQAVDTLFTEYANDFVTSLGVYLSFHCVNEMGRTGDDPAAAMVSMACNASRILHDILRHALLLAEEHMTDATGPDVAAILVQIQDLDGWDETRGSGTFTPPSWDA